MTCPCGDGDCPGVAAGVHDVTAVAVVKLPPVGVLFGLKAGDGD